MREWRVLVCIVALIASSIVIAACGSSSSSTPSAPTTCPAPVVPQDQLNRTADAGGGSLTIPVSANAGCTWTATSNASFITITSGASGSGNGSVTATVAANTGAQRTGTLTVAGATVTVTQASSAPCTFALSTTSLPMRDGGGTATVAVTTAAGCAWTAVSNSTFVTVTSGASGTGNGTVGISVAANTGAFRTGTLTIAGQTVTVSQDAAGICVTSISPTSQTFEAAGGTGTVTVAAPLTCGWQVSSNNDFITVAPGTRGNGDGSFSYTVAANTSTTQRQGTLSIGGVALTVTQNGSCPVTLSPASLSVDGGGRVESPLVGGSPIPVTLTMSGSCSWTATSNAPDWLRVNLPSGAGSATILVTIFQNNSGQTRSGVLTIAGQTIPVTQTACTFSLSPSTVTVSAAATTIDFVAQGSAGCLYNFNRTTDFLDVPFQSIGYTGQNTVRIGVPQNPGSSSRTEVLKMEGRESTALRTLVATATVTQSGTP